MKRFILALLALAIFAAPGALADRRDDTLRVVWGANGPIESVDLYFSTRRTTMEIALLAFDTLVHRDPATFEYRPLLARAWRQVDDRTLEFDLREDVRFHDGTPFTSRDVVATLTRVSDPAFNVRVPRNVNWIERVEADGPYRVRVISKTPFPPALDYLATALPIYPAEYYARVGPDGMHRAPIGTGPYRVTRVDTARAYRLERFDGYFRDGPKGNDFIRVIDIREVADAQTQVAELLSGRAHIIWDITSDQVEQIASVRGFRSEQAETMRVGYIGLDAAGRTSHPALRNVLVRQAIAHAVNRRAIVQGLVRGSARVVDAPCYDRQFGCVASAARAYDFNPDRARALLAEAGYPQGFDIEFYVIPLLRTVAEAVMADLSRVGIRVQLRTLEYPALHTAQFRDQTPMVLLSWGSYSVNDVSAMISLFFLPGQEDYARDPELHGWLQRAETIVDPAERQALYARAIERITDRVYWLPMYTFVKNFGLSDQITYTPFADEFIRLYTIRWR